MKFCGSPEGPMNFPERNKGSELYAWLSPGKRLSPMNGSEIPKFIQAVRVWD
jgi:hypothetical protein